MKTKPTLAILALAAALLLPAPPRAHAAPMTNDDIIILVQSGIAEPNIINAINKADPGFDLSPDALAALSRAEVPKKIINAMKQKSDATQTAGTPHPKNQPTPTPGSTKLQTDLENLRTFANSDTPAGLSGSDATKWDTGRDLEVTKRALALIDANPKDPLRWEAVIIMYMNEPEFCISYEVAQKNRTYYDPNIAHKAKTWLEQANWLMNNLKTATDVLPETRQNYEMCLVSMALKKGARFESYNKHSNFGNTYVDIPAILQALLAYMAHYPATDAMPLFTDFVKLVNPRTEDEKHALYTAFKDTPNTSVGDYVRTQLGRMDNAAAKLANLGNITFTALDGREVNLENLRGKVVLFHVWHTASGGEKNDHINLVKLYKAYHNKGLEIIGVCTDGTKNKDKVLAFIKEESIPWPESLEGRGRSQNRIVKALGLEESGRGIPNMTLVDKNGGATLVPYNHNPEPEIKRLLQQK